MAKKPKKIPPTAAQARKKTSGYKKVAVMPSAKEKQRWVMVKQKGKWEFAEAASAKATSPHMVCYYDPATGLYDDCHETAE